MLFLSSLQTHWALKGNMFIFTGEFYRLVCCFAERERREYTFNRSCTVDHDHQNKLEEKLSLCVWLFCCCFFGNGGRKNGRKFPKKTIDQLTKTANADVFHLQNNSTIYSTTATLFTKEEICNWQKVCNEKQ